MPPTQDPPTGPTMSPQQIMRARYKQQMMPARTWKQQQARDEQLVATNRARQTQNRSIYTAAAAQAARIVPQKVSNLSEIRPTVSTVLSPPGPPTTTTTATSSTTTTSDTTGIYRDGSSTSLSSLSQNARKDSPSAPKMHAAPFASAAASATKSRPPLNRRGSSTTSLSRAAATAAQQSPYRPAESLSSRLSSLSSRRSSGSEDLPPSSPNSVATPGSLTALTNESPKINHSLPPTLRRNSTSSSGSLLSQESPSQHQQQQQKQQQPQPQRRRQQQQREQQPPPRLAEVRTIDPHTGLPRVQLTSQAGAAARASASSPINIAPRQPLSAKFVSSLSQALRIQQEQREASDKLHDPDFSAVRSAGSNHSAGSAMAAANAQSVKNAAQPRKSTESTRSGRSMASSTMSGKSQGSTAPAPPPPSHPTTSSSSDQKYLISADQFHELHTQHLQQMQEKESRERKANEEIKANALRAALAAGTRVESDMVGIHMQVNDAVRNAQQRRNRRALMKRYRPAASWTAPVKMLKPQLKRLQTTDSVKSAAAAGGDEFSPRSVDTPLTATTPSSNLIPLNATPAGWPQAEIPEKWIGEPIPKVKQLPTTTSGGGAAPPQSPGGPTQSPVNRVSYPLSQMTMRSHPRPIKRERHDAEGVPPLVGSAHSGSSSLHRGLPGSPATSMRSEASDFAIAFDKNAGFDFRGRDDPDSNLTVPPHHHHHHHHYLHHHHHHHHQQPQLLSPQASASSSSAAAAAQQPTQTRMLRTLRGAESRKRFNEDKPWKGHREITALTDRERKRYESLWAANRDIHLPYLYVPPQYESAWLEALYAAHPELAPSNNNNSTTNNNNTNNTNSGNSGSSGGGSSGGGSGGSTGGNSTGPAKTNKPLHRRLGSSQLSPGYASSTHSADTFNSFRSADTDAASVADNALKPPGDVFDNMELKDSQDTGTSRATSSSTSRSNPLTPATSRQHAYDWGDYESDSGDEMPEDDRMNSRFNEDEDFDEPIDMTNEVEMRSDEVHSYVVARLWRRSRLPEEILAQIWDLVDLNKDGTLDRCGFVVGMWLCDQCLYGRKLPRKVPTEVWQSAGKLNLKIRIKQPLSKVGYMRKLPRFLGNVVGHTMHGGRQAVKKAVQTATK